MTHTIPPSQLEFVAGYSGWRIYRSSAGYEAYRSAGFEVIGKDDDGVDQWLKTDLSRVVLPGDTYEEAVACLQRYIHKPRSRKRKDKTLDLFEGSGT